MRNNTTYQQQEEIATGFGLYKKSDRQCTSINGIEYNKAVEIPLPPISKLPIQINSINNHPTPDNYIVKTNRVQFTSREEAYILLQHQALSAGEFSVAYYTDEEFPGQQMALLGVGPLKAGAKNVIFDNQIIINKILYGFKEILDQCQENVDNTYNDISFIKSNYQHLDASLVDINELLVSTNERMDEINSSFDNIGVSIENLNNSVENISIYTSELDDKINTNYGLITDISANAAEIADTVNQIYDSLSNDIDVVYDKLSNDIMDVSNALLSESSILVQNINDTAEHLTDYINQTASQIYSDIDSSFISNEELEPLQNEVSNINTRMANMNVSISNINQNLSKIDIEGQSYRANVTYSKNDKRIWINSDIFDLIKYDPQRGVITIANVEYKLVLEKNN